MKGMKKLQKCILWLMIVLLLLTNFDFSIFAKGNDKADITEENLQEHFQNGRVFEDINKNGIWDEGETGIENIQIKATLKNETEVKSEATTDKAGQYKLSNLTEESYTISFYAENEILDSYNLKKSIEVTSEEFILPQKEDTWFLQYQAVNISEDNLELGLQKDDIKESDIEVKQDAQEGAETALKAERFALSAKSTQRVTRPLHKYKGKNVTQNYTTVGNGYFSNANYTWIRLEGLNQALYCLQPGVGLLNGEIMNGYSGSLNKVFDAETALYLQRVAYYGCDFPGRTLANSDEKELYFMAAQTLIWQRLGVTKISWNTKDEKGNLVTIPIYSYMDEIKERIRNHNTVASFNGDTKTITYDGDNPDKVFSFTDTNKILSQSTISAKSNGIKSATINGNKLSVVLKNNDAYVGTTQKISFQKSFPSSFGNQYFTGSGGAPSQMIFYRGSVEPRAFNISLKIKGEGDLKITKKDDGGHSVEGVSFYYGTDKDNLKHSTEETNAKGNVTVKGITSGSRVYVKEKAVPSTLVKSNKIKSVVIKPSQTVGINFVNNRVQKSVTLRKLDAKTGKGIEGASFTYTTTIDGKTTSHTMVTNSLGEYGSLEKFPVGTVVEMIETSSPPGYAQPVESAKKQTKTLGLDSKENQFVFYNSPIQVRLSINKFNKRTKKPVQNVTFKIGPNVNGTLNAVDGYKLYTTNSAGQIISDEYNSRSTIYYQEYKTPTGYQLDTSIHKITFDSTNITKDVYNEEKPLQLHIIKKGDDNVPLKNVDFNIEEYSTATKTWVPKESLTTNSDGNADSAKKYSREVIGKGYLRLVETSTITGYKKIGNPIVLDTNMANIEKDIVDVTVVNERIPTKFTVFKYGENTSTPLQGAEFRITDKAGNLVETLVTGSNGEVTTENLIADTQYFYQETKAPKGYTITNTRKQELILNENSEHTYEYRKEIPNTPIYGYIEIHKTNKSKAPLNGIEFTIFQKSKPIETLITDKNGYAKSKKLLADAPYTVKETYAPPQYVSVVTNLPEIDFLNPPEKDYSGTNYGAAYNASTKTMSYQIENEEKTGKVTINKVDANNPNLKVQGATFRLTNYYTGVKVSEDVITDINGVAEFTNLPIVNPSVNSTQGRYVLEEITPGENHVLPSYTKKYFSLTYNSLDFKVTFDNPPITGGIEIKKVDNDNPTQKLAGAEFKLYNSYNLSTPIKEGKTDSQGILLFSNLRYGEYVIKETRSPEYHYNDLSNGGNYQYYDKSIKGYRVIIGDNGTVIPLTITNPKAKVKINVIKKDTAGHYLQGAKFNVVSSSNQILDTIMTDSTGNAYSKELDCESIGDNGYIVEAEKLVGYEANSTHYPISLNSNPDTQVDLISQTIVNTPEISAFKINKTDKDGNPVKATFKLETVMQYQDSIIEEFETTSTNPVIELDDYLQKVMNKMTDTFAIIKIEEIKTDNPFIRETQEMNFRLTYYNQQYSITPLNAEAWNKSISFNDKTFTLSLINYEIPVSLNLIKRNFNYTSSDDQYLSGAEFKITPKDSEPIMVTTTPSPYGVYVNLPYAESYEVEEVKAPSGYFTDHTIRTYLISDFTAMYTGADITSYNKKIELNNCKMPSLRIRKLGSDGKPLSAKFVVSDSPGEAPSYRQIVETDKYNGGYGTVDLSDSFVFDSDTIDKSIYIFEQGVSDNYIPYEVLIEGKSTMSYGIMKLDFSSAGNEYVQVDQSSDQSSVTLTVTNNRKDFDFNMQKKGINDEYLSATITMTAYKKGSLMMVAQNKDIIINSSTSTSVKSFFSDLDKDGQEGYDIYINETQTSNTSYKLLSDFKAFTYYPDNDIKEKFKDIDKHLIINQTGTTFNLTLQNEKAFGLHVLKRDKQENVANATFHILAGNGYEDVEGTIKTVNGDADLTPLLQKMYQITKESGKYNNWLIHVSESETEEWLQLTGGLLFSMYFSPTDLEESHNPYLQLIETTDGPANVGLIESFHGDYCITVKNANIPINFKLLKKDANDPTKYLANAVFEIKPEGKEAITATTTNDARGKLVELPYAKTYTVREIQAPEGYILDSIVHEYSIDDFEKKTAGSEITEYNMTQTYTNERIAGNFEITKYDADNDSIAKEKMKGAVFEIYKGNAPTSGTEDEKYAAITNGDTYTLVDTITINENGVGTSQELPYGDYTIKEITPPVDYQLSKKLISRKIQTNQATIYVNYPNKIMNGSLNLYKYAGVLGTDSEIPVPGAVFTIHKTSNDEQVGESITTMADGGSGAIELPYGDYYVKEVKFPAGYVSTKGTKHPFVIDSSHTAVSVNVQNTEAHYSFQLYKRDADTGDRLANATFGLFAKGQSPYATDKAEALQTFKTNTDGIATVMLEAAGDYDVYEIEAPKGYNLITNKIEIHVDDERQTTSVTIENHKKTMNIEIYKQEEGTKTPLAGASFEILNTLTNEVIATAGPTTTDGKVIVEVPAGDVDYIVKETIAPDGYVLDSNEYPVMVNTEAAEDGTLLYQAEPVIIENRKVNGNIRLIKKDKNQQERLLAGAVFGVYNSSHEEIEQITTNSNGEATTSELPIGNYTLKELRAPEGYILDDSTIYNAELTNEIRQVTITAPNIQKVGSVSLKKLDPTDANLKLSGAKFALFHSKEDAQNFINPILPLVTTNAEGIATFENLAYGKYYARETQAPEGYELIDYVQELSVNENSDVIPIEYINYKLPASATFTVVKRDKETAEALSGAKFLVEGPDSYSKEYVSNSSGEFQTDELPFGNYTVTETQAPKGYKLSAPRQQTVELNKNSLESPVTVTFLNEKIQTQIHIVKTDNGTPENPLMNAVFDIYALNDDGTRIEPAIDRLVTNENGEANSIILSEGNYEVIEVMAPEGYEFSIDGEKFKVEVNDDSKAITELKAINNPITGNLEVIKTDEETGALLAGVEFTIYQSSQAEDGEIYDTVFASITTNKEGKAVLSNIPYGTYTIRETKIPEGYALNEAYRDTFRIESDETKRNVSLHVTNKQIKGNIGLYKLDANQSDVGVPGATYGIYTKLITSVDGSSNVDPDSYLGADYDLTTLPDTIISMGSDPETGEQLPDQRVHQPAISKDLPIGTYYIKELKTPNGYQLNQEIYSTSISAEEEYVEIIAKDDALTGTLEVHKTDKDNAKPLKDAIFALYTKENYEKLINDKESEQEVEAIYITTDENGYANTENLKLNQEYVLVEYKAPDGYEKDDTIHEVFMPTTDQLTFMYSYTNTKKSEIVIHKVNEAGYPLEGVIFKLYSFGNDNNAETEDDIEIAAFGTGYDGKGIARYESKTLANGWYYVKETKEPDMGFELSKEIKPFQITDEQHEFDFTFVNYRSKGDVEIWKKDEMGNVLHGAQFAIYKAGDSWFTEESIPNNDVYLQDFVMDEGAHSIIRNLPVDCYVIKETVTPEGYKKAGDIFFDLNNGEMQTVNGTKHYYYREEITNDPIIGHIEVQKSLSNNAVINSDISLQNAKFQILNDKKEIEDVLITDEAGKATSKELKQGIYTIKEIQAPDGTVLNEAIGTVTIDGSQSNDIYSYKMVNDIVTGQLQILKKGEHDEKLTGAEFDIVNEKGEIVTHVISDDDGIARCENLAYGWYTIRETKAPVGHVMDPNMKWKAFINEDLQTVELEITNPETKDQSVQVIKYDKDQPTKRLPGAKFALYAKNDLVTKLGEYTTGADGTFQLNTILPGDYVLIETKAPVGYTLDDTPQTFTLNVDSNIAIYLSNEVPKGRVKFEKKGEMLQQMIADESYPQLKKLEWGMDSLEGAEIGIYAKDTTYIEGITYQEGDLILNLKSSQTSTYLPVGKYTYKEIKAPPSYLLDTQSHEITVEEEKTEDIDTTIVSMENMHGKAHLQLYKKFADSENPVYFNNVKFGVYTAEDIVSNSITIPQNTLLSVFGLSEAGKSVWNDQALPEGRYYVRELETKEGYVLDAHKYPFALSYQNKDTNIELSTQTKPIINEPLYGTIRLNKTGDQFTDVNVYEKDALLIHEPVYSIDQLAGAEVEIYTAQEIKIGDVVYQTGDIVDTLISGKKEESRRLPLGTYTAKEVKTPPGYILDETEHSIILVKNEDDVHAAVWEELAIYNKKATVEINIYKKFFNTNDSNLFKDVTFGIYAAEEIKGNTNAAVLKKDELIQLIGIDANGKGSSINMLPPGNFYIKELTTAEGYQLDNQCFSFTVEQDAEGVIQVADISQSHPIINLPDGTLTPFAFRKVNEEGIPLAGAVFKLYLCEQVHTHQELASSDVDGCWKEVEGLSPRTSGKDGIVDFGKLPDGDYQLQEVEAPEGYTVPIGQWYIHIANGITLEERGTPRPPAFAKIDDANYKYQLINRRSKELPILGGRGIFLYIGGGSLLLLAASWLMKRREDEKNEEKN